MKKLYAILRCKLIFMQKYRVGAWPDALKLYCEITNETMRDAIPVMRKVRGW